METKDTCLYIHTRKSDGRIIYVGIGNEKRPYDMTNRGKFWKDKVKGKGGVEVTILKTGMSWKEACDLEIKMIAFYGRIEPSKDNLNYGCLVNMTDGGDGTKGFIPGKETRKKMSDKRVGEKNPMFGVDRSGEKNPMFGKTGEKCPNFGKKKPKHSIRMSGEGNPKSKKIICIITDKVYDCIVNAAIELGLKRTTLNWYLRNPEKNKTSLRYL